MEPVFLLRSLRLFGAERIGLAHSSASRIRCTPVSIYSSSVFQSFRAFSSNQSNSNGKPVKKKLQLPPRTLKRSPAAKQGVAGTQPSATDAAYVASRAHPPAPIPRVNRMRMTPDRDEIVEEGIDAIQDRVVPKWPLSKESFPTLQLHLIRTPRVSKNLSFTQLMTLLENSPEPEVLLYQAEPHRLYFIVLYSLAFVFAVYGLLFLDWALRESYEIFIKYDIEVFSGLVFC